MVLNHRESSYIHTVHMRFVSDYSFCDLIRTLFHYAKKFNPRVILVEVPLVYRHFLGFMFWCESVEDMSLKINRFRNWASVPNCLYLPCLKKLFHNNSIWIKIVPSGFSRDAVCWKIYHWNRAMGDFL